MYDSSFIINKYIKLPKYYKIKNEAPLKFLWTLGNIIFVGMKGPDKDIGPQAAPEDVK